MKKALIIALSLMLLLSFISCGNSDSVPNDGREEIIGDWQLDSEEESPYGIFLSFNESTAAYGFSVELEEGQDILDYLPTFKVMASLFEVEYSIEDGSIILHEKHLNGSVDEETGEAIEGEDARIAYTVEGDTLVFGGYTYIRIAATETDGNYYEKKSS